MKTLKQQLDKYLKLDCDWVLDDEGKKIDVYGTPYWTADTEKDYQHQEELINAYNVSNSLITISAWCDISGFDYWVIQQEESNYVSYDVILLKDVYTDDEVLEINRLIIEADLYFDSVLTPFKY